MKNLYTIRRSNEDKLYDAIIQYIEEHGYPPTIRELGDITGFKSTSSVQLYLNKLMECGKLETDAPSSPRAIRVPGYKFVKV